MNRGFADYMENWNSAVYFVWHSSIPTVISSPWSVKQKKDSIFLNYFGKVEAEVVLIASEALQE